MERPLIAVFRGGYSGEAVISHQSAQRMLEALDPARFDAVFVTIAREGWSASGPDGRVLELDRATMAIDQGRGPVTIAGALIAIHGSPGEDGLLQGWLDMLGIPYQTGDVLCMSTTFSKYHTTALLRQWGFEVAASVLLDGPDPEGLARAAAVGLPCFVKPDRSGSSLGVSKVKTIEELLPALQAAFSEGPTAMVEAAVSGRELTCGVMRLDGKVMALPLCEVRTSREFFDYEAKYHATDTEELVPAPVPEEVSRLVQERSVAIYKALQCRGMVRVDHFWDGGRLVTIEVNTVPGFSKASIFPKMLEAAGIGVERAVNALAQDLLQAGVRTAN